MKLTPTDVATYAQTTNLPLYEIADLSKIPNITKPDFLVVAGYGQKIPTGWLEFPRVMAINMHQSLLPEYRGANPSEWAILRGETKTGVTLLKMSEDFDQGDIIAQKEIAIEPTDTRQTLYDKLYRLGAELLVETLPKKELHPRPQPKGDFFYARRLTRDDGFVPWEKFDIHSKELETKLRAFEGWPGVWTITPFHKRLKLLELGPEPIVQLEGKSPQTFVQFSRAYRTVAS